MTVIKVTQKQISSRYKNVAQLFLSEAGHYLVAKKGALHVGFDYSTC